MYTLRFPFRLPEGQEIVTKDSAVEIALKQCRLTKAANYYVLTIDGFPSEDEARNFVSNLWSGLMWVLLNAGLAPEAVLEISTVTYVKNPEAAAANLAKSFGLPADIPVDGLIDGSIPAVFLTNKRLGTITGGNCSITIGTPSDRVFQLLREHSLFQAQTEPLNDSKLRVALDLYRAYFTESSPNARFLTLVMVLEALAVGTPRPQPVLDLLKKWQDEVADIKTTLAGDPDCTVALDSLSRELLFRRENSIRSQIHSLVFLTLNNSGDADAEQTAKAVVKIYDHRSTLVHDGKLDPQILGQAMADVKSIAERVLRARFTARAQQAMLK